MRQRGSIFFGIAALVVALATFGGMCQNYYRVSVWMAAYDQKRIESDKKLAESLETLSRTLKKL